MATRINDLCIRAHSSRGQGSYGGNTLAFCGNIRGVYLTRCHIHQASVLNYNIRVLFTKRYSDQFGIKRHTYTLLFYSITCRIGSIIV